MPKNPPPEQIQRRKERRLARKGRSQAQTQTKLETEATPAVPTGYLIPPMLCKDGSEEMLGTPGYILQQKYDGSRVVLYKGGYNIRFIGRSFKNDFAPMYPELVAEARELPWDRCVLDAELTFFRGETDVFITALATAETKTSYEVRLMVFDIISCDESPDPSKLGLRDRLLYLGSKLSVSGHIRMALTIYDHQQHREHYHRIVSGGGEGVVLKEANSPYLPGERRHWYKVKKTQTAECVVMGVTEGTGVRKETFGALILGQYDEQGILQPVANCSGFTQAELADIHLLIGTIPEETYTHVQKWRSQVQKLIQPVLVVEVEYMDRTNTQKLRFPRFIRFRNDKQPTECRLPTE